MIKIYESEEEAIRDIGLSYFLHKMEEATKESRKRAEKAPEKRLTFNREPKTALEMGLYSLYSASTKTTNYYYLKEYAEKIYKKVINKYGVTESERVYAMGLLNKMADRCQNDWYRKEILDYIDH